jgi:ACR3 family arsenite transporter
MRLLTHFAVPGLFLGAIVVGSLVGVSAPEAGETLGGLVDITVLLLVGLLLFEVRFGDLRRIGSAPRFLAVALGINFVVIPLIGWGIAGVAFAGREPALFLGLFIYFMAPCTDWFLGFTRLSNGNVGLGAVLLPINMIVQLLLYPVYLRLAAGEQTGIDLGSSFSTVIQWFVIPLVAAVVVRAVARFLLPERSFAGLLRAVGRMIPAAIALLIVELFAAHIETVLDHAGSFAMILGAAVLFFTVTYGIGEAASRTFRFAGPERALLVMTTAARNAPLMLALTTVALPGQPLVYAAIMVGMLVEFPHLTLLRSLLLRGGKTRISSERLLVVERHPQ